MISCHLPIPQLAILHVVPIHNKKCIDRKIELYCCVGLVESFTVCKDLNMAQSRKLYLLIFKKRSTSGIRVSRVILNASEAGLVRIVEAKILGGG